MKKFISSLLAVTMLVSAISIPTYARYDSATGDYKYRSTTDLEVDVDGDKVVVTFPAVDTKGNIIKANPMTADGQLMSTGNPTAGWTNPTSGMIIAYNKWSPNDTEKPANDNSTNYKVLMGVVDKETDIPLEIHDPHPDANDKFIKNAYLDTTVVADSFCTGYMIQYSEDGQKWNNDHEISSFNHGKKLRKAGAAKDDNFNTFFLEDQITEALTTNLKAGKEYKIRVVAYDKSNPSSLETAPYHTFTPQTVVTAAAKELTPAFPTVEGGGKFSQGGRGTAEQPGDVYVVTNLTDSVTNPQPGSFRYGLERKDTGNKTAPRTIVFAVGGTIKIDSTADKNARRFNVTDNTTIAGQTAPGQGITFYGGSFKFSGNNIIVRYIRVKLGEGYDMDAATASGENIVIDHCTFNWGVDECFTAKELINSSIQYNIIANSLSMVNKNGVLNGDNEIAAGESEAKHGMGSIMNGYETTFTHNLYANNGTRNPRFEGSFSYNNVTYNNLMQFSNNVIYNWGHNTGYGGERGAGQVTFTNNYHKPGPNTIAKVKNLIFDFDGVSKFYFNGNVVEGNPEVSANNATGVKDFTASDALKNPVELTNPYEEESAQAAYEKVLKEVGASYARDAQDARLIYDVENNSGYFINSEFEDGGVFDKEYKTEAADTDGDGMPDSWEDAMKLDKNNKADAGMIVTEDGPTKGYSNIEVYINDILGEWDNAEKKAPEAAPIEDVLISSADTEASLAAPYAVLVEGVPCNVSASNFDEVYLNADKVAEATSNKATFVPDKTGVYNLSLLSYNADGEPSIFSDPIKAIVVPKDADKNIAGYTATDIGDVGAAGTDLYSSGESKLTSVGTGHIGTLNTSSTQGPDRFHYDYKQVKGDFTFTARIDNLTKVDYLQHSGLMARASLDPLSEFYMASLTYLKGEDYEGLTDVSGNYVKAKNIRTLARTTEGGAAACTNKFLGIPQKRADLEPNHGWGRLTREGQTITISASLNGADWYVLNTYTTTLPETCYIGFATDAAQDEMDFLRTNVTEFSNISLDSQSIDIDKLPAPTLLGDTNCDGSVTATDAAVMLGYVLSPSDSEIDEQGLANGDVYASKTFDSSNVAQILQKALKSDYMMPAETIAAAAVNETEPTEPTA